MSICTFVLFSLLGKITALTDIDSKPHVLYDLPEVDRSGKFACHDYHGVEMIDFIHTADATQEGLVDPADDDPALMRYGHTSAERTAFYEIMMAIGNGVNGNKTPNRTIYKSMNEVWTAQKKILSDPYNSSLTTQVMQTDHLSVWEAMRRLSGGHPVTRQQTTGLLRIPIKQACHMMRVMVAKGTKGPPTANALAFAQSYVIYCSMSGILTVQEWFSLGR